MTLLQKIKQAELVGRGGAGFPVAVKWEVTRDAEGSEKFVIMNASEGELAVFKDLAILHEFPETVIKGMVLAMDFLKTKEGWLNINAHYWKQVGKRLKKAVTPYEKRGYSFHVFKETPSYIGGEETALLNAIEGKRLEPRRRPPFPVESGLWEKPTLVHNVETLFNVALVEEGRYERKRFYCLSGKLRKPGVYHLPDSLTLYEVLEQTGNLPAFDFFVQVGGGASGIILDQKQTKTSKMTGAGSLVLYPMTQDIRALLLEWFAFYAKESCGKCTPCREGSWQLYKLVRDNREVPWKDILRIASVMGKTSFCALGKSIMIPVMSLKSILPALLSSTPPKDNEK
jgi:NADH:ubiquinone oxidoreductase subunit F (NADH-binding)